jgi:hypothetical protein
MLNIIYGNIVDDKILKGKDAFRRASYIFLMDLTKEQWKVNNIDFSNLNLR